MDIAIIIAVTFAFGVILEILNAKLYLLIKSTRSWLTDTAMPSFEKFNDFNTPIEIKKTILPILDKWHDEAINLGQVTIISHVINIVAIILVLINVKSYILFVGIAIVAIALIFAFPTTINRARRISVSIKNYATAIALLTMAEQIRNLEKQINETSLNETDSQQ
jgi:hypothetical protein